MFRLVWVLVVCDLCCFRFCRFIGGMEVGCLCGVFDVDGFVIDDGVVWCCRCLGALLFVFVLTCRHLLWCGVELCFWFVFGLAVCLLGFDCVCCVFGDVGFGLLVWVVGCWLLCLCVVVLYSVWFMDLCLYSCLPVYCCDCLFSLIF